MLIEIPKFVEIVEPGNVVPTVDKDGIPTTKETTSGKVVTVGGKIVSSSMRKRLGVDTRPRIEAVALDEFREDQAGRPGGRYDYALRTPSYSRVNLLG